MREILRMMTLFASSSFLGVDIELAVCCRLSLVSVVGVERNGDHSMLNGACCGRLLSLGDCAWSQLSLLFFVLVFQLMQQETFLWSNWLEVFFMTRSEAAVPSVADVSRLFEMLLLDGAELLVRHAYVSLRWMELKERILRTPCRQSKYYEVACCCCCTTAFPHFCQGHHRSRTVLRFLPSLPIWLATRRYTTRQQPYGSKKQRHRRKITRPIQERTV